MAFEPIFQPLKFRNLTVKNRDLPVEHLGPVRQLRRLGQPGANQLGGEVRQGRGRRDHLVVRAGDLLRGRIVPNYAMIDHDRHIPFWRAVGKAVHAHDCRFIIQLSHGGRQRDIQGVEYPVGLSSTSKPDPGHGFRCQAMTLAEIRTTVDAFAEGPAARARQDLTASNSTARTDT